METLWQDVRFGFRSLATNPAFTLVAMLSLALGIGANTAIFTVTNAVFLSPIPVREPSRLMRIETSDRATKTSNPALDRTPVSILNYEDFRAQNDVFTDVSAFIPFGATLSGAGDPQPLPVQLVSANYFDLLGVRAMLGRTFLPDEDKKPGGNPVCVLSHSLWTRQFGADSNLVGRTITLNSVPYTVAGVMPPNFKGTFTVGDPDVIWIPLSMHSQVLSGPAETLYNNRRMRLANLFGRLKPGVEPAQAAAQLKTIASRLEREYPLANDGRTAVVSPLAEGVLGGLPRDTLLIAAIALSGVVGMVLLIACFNLANMLLARAARREKEMGIRTALGAGRGRLIRQLLTESLLLAAGGGLGGLLMARWGSELLWSFRPSFLVAQAVNLRLDPRVLGFTLAITLLTGLVFGLAPAIRASTPHLNEVLKTGGRGNTAHMHAGLRSTLVISQVAFTMVALASAGLFIRSMQNVQRVDLGFEARNFFTFGMDLSTLRWTPEQGRTFQRQVLDRMRALPGVEAAALSSNAPIGGGLLRTVLTPEQAAAPNPRGALAGIDTVSPEYFATLHIPLRNGRAFTDFDRAETAPVIVINQAAARIFFPGEQAVGKRLKFLGEDFMREVVGTCGDTVTVTIGETPQPVIYVPLAQDYQPFLSVDVRTRTAPEAMLSAAVAEVHRLNSSLALAVPQTVQQLIGTGLWAPRMGAALFGIFGLLGLLLAAIGIYGVMAYMVAQRTNEIGIRMALGAARTDVLGMVVQQALRLALAGILIGLAGGLLITRLMSNLLFSVSAADPLTYSAVSLVLAAAAFTAAWIPAWRASGIDPVTALRD
jgi:putative ABC transport system permease protein